MMETKKDVKITREKISDNLKNVIIEMLKPLSKEILIEALKVKILKKQRKNF